MKRNATKYSIVLGLIPLIVGIPYTIAWAIRPSNFLNLTFGIPYALLAVLLVFIGILFFILGLIFKKVQTSSARRAGLILGANVILGGWLLFFGPGSAISVSNAIIENQSTQTISLVTITAPGEEAIIRRIRPNDSKQKAIIPQSEGALSILVEFENGELLQAEAFILECCAATFHVEVSDTQMLINTVDQ